MKGIISWAIFAAFYIIIILIFQVSAQFPNSARVTDKGENKGAQEEKTVNNNGASQVDAESTLEKWGITDPVVKQTINNVYGTMMGQPECVKKSICIMGTYFHNLPGRDAIFTLLGRYVPPEWGLLYDIFRVSVMYGQNCDAYLCDPMSGSRSGSTPVPTSSMFLTTAPPMTTPPRDQPHQFDNQIHKQSISQNLI